MKKLIYIYQILCEHTNNQSKYIQSIMEYEKQALNKLQHMHDEINKSFIEDKRKIVIEHHMPSESDFKIININNTKACAWGNNTGIAINGEESNQKTLFDDLLSKKSEIDTATIQEIRNINVKINIKKWFLAEINRRFDLKEDASLKNYLHRKRLVWIIEGKI